MLYIMLLSLVLYMLWCTLHYSLDPCTVYADLYAILLTPALYRLCYILYYWPLHCIHYIVHCSCYVVHFTPGPALYMLCCTIYKAGRQDPYWFYYAGFLPPIKTFMPSAATTSAAGLSRKVIVKYVWCVNGVYPYILCKQCWAATP